MGQTLIFIMLNDRDKTTPLSVAQWVFFSTKYLPTVPYIEYNISEIKGIITIIYLYR